MDGVTPHTHGPVVPRCAISLVSFSIVVVPSSAAGGGTVKYRHIEAAPHVAGLLIILTVCTDGFAAFDPDGSHDPIAVMC